MEIEIGSIVQIKSGGPNMTVTGFLSKENGEQYEKGIGLAILKKTDKNTNDYAICKWFDNKDTYKTGVFNFETIEVQ